MPGTAQPGGSSPISANPATLSRESVLLQKLEEHARWIIAGGVVWGVAGLLLLAGLSASPAGVVFSGMAMVGFMLASIWADRTERRGRREIIIFTALMGLFLIADPLSKHMDIHQLGQALGLAGVLVGPFGLYSGLSLLRLAPPARNALNGSTVDARLEVDVRNTGYGGMPRVTASLWPADTVLPPARAMLGPAYSVPRLTPVDKVPATVHGTPVNRAVVVASCPECVLVGRVRHSTFGKNVPRRRAVTLAKAVVSGILAVLALALIWSLAVGIELGDVKHPVGSAFGAVIIGAFGVIMWVVARAEWQMYRRQT